MPLLCDFGSGYPKTRSCTECTFLNTPQYKLIRDKGPGTRKAQLAQLLGFGYQALPWCHEIKVESNDGGIRLSLSGSGHPAGADFTFFWVFLPFFHEVYLVLVFENGFQVFFRAAWFVRVPAAGLLRCARGRWTEGGDNITCNVQYVFYLSI